MGGQRITMSLPLVAGNDTTSAMVLSPEILSAGRQGGRADQGASADGEIPAELPRRTRDRADEGVQPSRDANGRAGGVRARATSGAAQTAGCPDILALEADPSGGWVTCPAVEASPSCRTRTAETSG